VTTDGRTGVLTSRAWSGRATALVDGTGPGEGWTLLLVHLDRFASVDAVHGHPAADLVLPEVARAVRTAAPSGLIGCFGGDTLVVLIGRDGTAGTRPGQQPADVVRRAVADLDVEVHRADDTFHVRGVTASVGIASSRAGASAACCRPSSGQRIGRCTRPSGPAATPSGGASRTDARAATACPRCGRVARRQASTNPAEQIGEPVGRQAATRYGAPPGVNGASQEAC